MQNAQCKICPYCQSVQSLDSRYCSQCSEVLNESTYSTLFKYKNTIAITALGTTCAFLIIVLFAYFGSYPKSQITVVTSNENKQTNGGITNTTANNTAANASNADLTKTKPKKSPSPLPAIEEITDDESDVEQNSPSISGKTKSRADSDDIENVK